MMVRGSLRRGAPLLPRPTLALRAGMATPSGATSVKARREKAEAADPPPRAPLAERLDERAEKAWERGKKEKERVQKMVKKQVRKGVAKGEAVAAAASPYVDRFQAWRKSFEARLPPVVAHYLRSSTKLVANVFAVRRTRKRLASAEDRESVTREEVVTAMQTGEDAGRAAVMLALFAVPFVGYVLPVLYGAAFPRLLPRVFWTEAQQRRYRPAMLMRESAFRVRSHPALTAAMVDAAVEAAADGRHAQYADLLEPFWELVRKAAARAEAERAGGDDDGEGEGGGGEAGDASDGREGVQARLNDLLARSEGLFDSVLELSAGNQTLHGLRAAYLSVVQPLPGVELAGTLLRAAPRRAARQFYCRRLERRVDLLREDDRLLRAGGGAAPLSLAELRDACHARGVPNPFLENAARLDARRRKLRQWVRPTQLGGRALSYVQRAAQERAALRRARAEDPDAKPPKAEDREPLKHQAELAEVERETKEANAAEEAHLRAALDSWLELTGRAHPAYSTALFVAASVLKHSPVPALPGTVELAAVAAASK